jgi:phage terminase small subunit
MGIGGAKPDVVSQRTGASNRPAPDPADAAGEITWMEKPELSELGGQVWDQITPPLFTAKILRLEDVIMLVEVCEAWGLVWYFRKALWTEINGMNDSNEVKRLRAGWAQSLSHARSMLGDLGVGPVSRIRTGLMKASSGGLLDELPGL